MAAFEEKISNVDNKIPKLLLISDFEGCAEKVFRDNFNHDYYAQKRFLILLVHL